MFTLCTRTVYLGADFYSTNAKSYIFSDANIDSLSVDITIDLPQILGRQRLETNPWKNRADLYYKTIGDRKMDIYENIVNKKSKLALVGLGYVGMPIAVAFAKKIKGKK